MYIRSNHSRVLATLVLWLVLFVAHVRATDLVQLNAENWDQFAPNGKEVDCIYGDYVLRNDLIVAVIGEPKSGRDANMTVRNVGGAVIDLTCRDHSNDQLSAFYPGAAAYSLAVVDSKWTDTSAELHLRADAEPEKPQVDVHYRLQDGDESLLIETRFTNPHAEPIEFEAQDSMRADRFSFDFDAATGLLWALDEWWRKAYGVTSPDHTIVPMPDTMSRGRPFLTYANEDGSKVTLAPGDTHVVSRRLTPAASLLQLKGLTRSSGSTTHAVTLEVRDAKGPVELAKVTVSRDDVAHGFARTGGDGLAEFKIAPGAYSLTVEANGRPNVELPLTVEADTSDKIEVSLPGYVVARVQDENGQPIPCKVEFMGQGDTPDPYFGPDTFVYGIHNLRYTPNGKFRQEIGPGRYDVVVSHGNEYDAVFTTIDVAVGEETQLQAVLRRSVDTTGWVSSDFHSHSSPSGDNVSSQRGRVLNLLSEHIEFAPCTEHNRVSSYDEHLQFFDAETLMATCAGIELTGSPLPVNHQNAFPLKHTPRTQDGGGPRTDINPLVQIERLAFWDNRADKVVQGNHPNLRQIIGDRNLDGRPDSGFARMFGLMDVVEVHPPHQILTDPTTSTQSEESDNVIFNWLQMLNLGYRIPGVVNTDAHYNFHGSGWLRNYLKADTDDPAQLNLARLIRTTERGNIVMTNGPFLEVSVRSDSAGVGQLASPGDNLLADDGEVEIDIRVQCANWLDINRVQVFLNGVATPDLNFTRRSGSKEFGDEVVKFETTIPLTLQGDTHIIVAAAGEGLTLGPVMGPQHGKDMPIAVTNPIFVDIDDNGFQPNADDLGQPLPIGSASD